MANGLIQIESKGTFTKLDGFFKKQRKKNFEKYLRYFGELGCEALAMETPIDTAETALSWGYEIIEEDGSMSLVFTNDAKAGNIPVVILIVYGHGTKNGGYVQPYDFVNPITKELFENIADTIWREVIV